MFSINEVVGFIIRSDHAVNMADMQDSDLTNLKLQKLLYYSQGHSLGELGKPLFNEDFVAWQHGPVISSVYSNFSYLKSDLIGYEIGQEEKYNCHNIANNKVIYDLLTRILNYYNQYSPWKLRDMSHEESPWKNVNIRDVISKESLEEFFSKKNIKERI